MEFKCKPGSAILRRNFRFFFEQAGYCVGYRAEGALKLAKAELEALARNYSFDWVVDANADSPGMYGCICKSGAGEFLVSLWGIDTNSNPYRRVVEAELALEAIGSDPLWSLLNSLHAGRAFEPRFARVVCSNKLSA